MSRVAELVAEDSREYSAEERWSLRCVLGAIPFPVCLIDEGETVFDCNDAFAFLLGLAREGVLGKPLAEVLPGRDAPSMAGAGSAGQPVPVDGVGGEGRALLARSPIFDENGKRTGWVATLQELPESEVAGRRQKEEEIHRLAYHDILTGLPNRTLLRDRLTMALARAARHSRKIGVLFLDLDRFKRINDTLGHAVGDLLLQAVAERLAACLRNSDTVARLGGDEFVILLPDIVDLRDINAIAAKILESFDHPFDAGGQEIFCSTSIGVAVSPVDGDEVDTLLNNADLAMYAAKERGRNTYQFFSAEMNSRAMGRLDMENGLRRAMQNDELFLVYHPQLDLSSGKITGLEALLRWNHPTLGLVPPRSFIPLAEETGLILPLGEWVLRTACAQARIWQEAGHPALRVAVNLSGCQFKQPSFIDTVEGILRETGLPPCCLELELTESILMENVEESIRLLAELKVRGIHLAIDDFGTGYSSLGHLKNFPIDRIKIAQSFVQEVTTDPDNAAIVEAIVALAKSLDLKLIAEGVETRDQLWFLQARHCHEMQGFYFSPPVSGKAFSRYLDEGLARDGVCLFRLPPG